MHQTIRRDAVEKAVRWLIKNNSLYRTVNFNKDWYKTGEKFESKSSLEDFESLFDTKGERHTAKKHDSEDEEKKEDDGDIVEGGPVLYDSTVVDNVPVLPTRDDGNSISIAPGEGKTPISRRTEHVDQLGFPGIFSQGECSYSLDREVPLSLGQYYNSLTWRQDSRCTESTFIFHAQCQKEKEHLQSTINFQAKKGAVKDMKMTLM